MKRRKRTTAERLRLFEARGGICYLCQGRINVGEAWELEHRIALEISGDDTDDNLELAHQKCHRDKTRVDAADIARAKRREAKHMGAKVRGSWGAGRNTPFKAKIGGGIVRR